MECEEEEDEEDEKRETRGDVKGGGSCGPSGGKGKKGRKEGHRGGDLEAEDEDDDSTIEMVTAVFPMPTASASTPPLLLNDPHPGPSRLNSCGSPPPVSISRHRCSARCWCGMSGSLNAVGVGAAGAVWGSTGTASAALKSSWRPYSFTLRGSLSSAAAMTRDDRRTRTVKARRS